MWFSLPATIVSESPSTVITERQDSKSNEDIPITIDESFTKELDTLTVTSLKTSTSTGSLEMNFRKLSLPHDKEKSNPAFTRSKSSSVVVSNHVNETSIEKSKTDSSNPCNMAEKKNKSGAAKAFFKGLTSAEPKATNTRHMDMDNPYMRHTLKRKSKKITNTETSTNNTIVLSHNTSNDDDNQTAEPDDKKSGRQSWGTEMPDFSHLPGTIREFSKVYSDEHIQNTSSLFSQEQASIEEILSEHEEIADVLTTRQDVSNDFLSSIKY